MTKYTTYAIAVNWLNNDFVLCNNITEVDPSTLENMRFDYYDEESDSCVDIYQYFITDASQGDVEFLEKNFNLKFTYSDLLDSFILCVDHWGTGWDYVSCECSEDLLKYNPELEYNDSCYPPKRETTRRIIKGGRQ